ncbi:MAG: dihydrofolate reductase [Ktedonobacteraceae bacterium]|nr:dihydrofolate reductase [Ktedonobacteraceae bacterium]
MRKIITTMWVTLDGFISGPNNDMGFVGEVFDAAMGQYGYDFVSAADTLILGRTTYESFAGSWPHVPDRPGADPDEVAYANMLNAMRKIVFSKTLASAEWNNSTLLREIVPAEIEQLKQEPGRNIIIYGSASIVQALTNYGLIDEYQLLLHPFILGGGKPLFQNIKEKTNLKLVDTRTHPSGVVVLTYQLK